MNTTQINAATVRSANTLSSVVKTGKSVTYRNVGGNRGHHLMIEAGARVVVWGSSQRYRAGERGVFFTPYRVEFKVGDIAVCGGYNLTYTGKIISIGQKTITVEEYSGTCNARRHRMSIERFASWNDHFDLDAIRKQNSEWMD